MKTGISDINHFKTERCFTISSRLKKIKEVKARDFFSITYDSSDCEVNGGAYSIND